MIIFLARSFVCLPTSRTLLLVQAAVFAFSFLFLCGFCYPRGNDLIVLLSPWQRLDSSFLCVAIEVLGQGEFFLPMPETGWPGEAKIRLRVRIPGDTTLHFDVPEVSNRNGLG